MGRIMVAGELMVLRARNEGYAGLLLSAIPPLAAPILVIPSNADDSEPGTRH